MTLKRNRRAYPAGGFLLCALAAVLASGQAQAKPNFSGEWKLNPGKSEFGPLPAPESRTDKITHADPSLTVTTTQKTQAGEGTAEFKYTTDGAETTNQYRNSPMKSTCKWDADTLLVTTK